MTDSTEGQPDSIVQDIETMVRSYVAKVFNFAASSYAIC